MPDPEREFAVHVLERLRAAGFEAYWAGGCVRDQLLARRPKDYDVATSALPPQIREVFGRRKTLEIGAAFGVVAVVGPRGAGTVEVTTFRRDATYSDGRHPDSVSFSNAQDDAQRRDFTINGLFFDPIAEQVIDYVGGQADLERRIVRAIGDARARFSEDKLRMLRAVRIAATFDFALDEATEAAIVEMAATIVVVSPERIAQEMRKVLETDHRRRGIELLARTRLLETLLPEVEPLRLAHEANLADDSTWSRTLATLESLEQPGFPLALAALLSHAGAANDPRNPDEVVPVATAIARRWRLSNKEADRVAWLLTHRHGLRQVSSLPWSRWQRLVVTDGVEELLALDEAACRAEGHDVKHLELCRDRLRLPAEQLNPAPLLDGRDLLAHGVPQGEIFRRLLDAARDAQLDGQIRTKAEALALVDRLRNGPTPW